MPLASGTVAVPLRSQPNASPFWIMLLLVSGTLDNGMICIWQPIELRTLIGEMSCANRLWGAPRIHGELLKLGFDVAQSTVARYMGRRFGPPSQGWRTFLNNHADGIAAVDLFVLRTVAFQILYCLVILRRGRRFWMSFGVTSNPTAEWITRQITEAFPWDHAPEYLIRDRDRSYGSVFVRRLCAMGIRDRPIAPRSPWQKAYVERLIGTIRRECLDHIIVFGETHLRRIVGAYAAYYNESRTHRSLDKDAPLHRAIQRHHITTRPRRTSSPILKNLIFGTDSRLRCRDTFRVCNREHLGSNVKVHKIGCVILSCEA